jgi:hypothetical protein
MSVLRPKASSSPAPRGEVMTPATKILTSVRLSSLTGSDVRLESPTYVLPA